MKTFDMPDNSKSVIVQGLERIEIKKEMKEELIVLVSKLSYLIRIIYLFFLKKPSFFETLVSFHGGPTCGHLFRSAIW